MRQRRSDVVQSDKLPSGIRGFDEITGGGLPRGRVTIVLGGAGCGKTIFALQTLVAGASAGEPGLFVAFEEGPDHVLKDARRFDWSAGLHQKGVGFLDAQLSQSVAMGGEFDLVGLLAMTSARAKQLGARRVVFDGLDVLLAHLADPLLVRREVFRLREWAYASGLTALITAKAEGSGSEPPAVYDFLQFLADCVISLQHRVSASSAGRTLRVSKFRGTPHSANEFPFTIDRRGIVLVAGTSTVLQHLVLRGRVTSGVPQLDQMLGGGYYRGSSVLISGAPGTSKTSLSAAFAQAAALRKEKTIYVSFDEAPEQIVRNVASIGIDLAAHARSGMLTLCSLRARSDNPESHVARIGALIEEHRAKNLIVDPLSALAHTSDPELADRAAVQVLDIAKSQGVTCVSTSLLSNAAPASEETPIGISTIADTWMHVSYLSKGGERNRALTIVKSRGTNHSSQVRELVLADGGISLAEPYFSGGEVLMGTLRWERESADRRARQASLTETELQERQAQLSLAETELRIETLRTELAMRQADLERIVARRLAEHESHGSEVEERVHRRGGRSLPAAKGKRR